MRHAEFTVTIRSDGAIDVKGTLFHASQLDQLVSALKISRAALPQDDPDFDAFTAAIRTDGQKITAIKLCRTLASLGLKEAKDLVEEIESNQRPMPANRGELLAMAGTPFSRAVAA